MNYESGCGFLFNVRVNVRVYVMEKWLHVAKGYLWMLKGY